MSGSSNPSINGVYRIAPSADENQRHLSYSHKDDENPYYEKKHDTQVLYWAKTDQKWVIAEKVDGIELAAEPARSSVGVKPPRYSGWIGPGQGDQETSELTGMKGAN